MVEKWSGEWTGSVRDLELIERNDLQPMVKRNCALLVRDTRQAFRALLLETLTDIRPQFSVFVREYAIFLQAGRRYKVPSVKVRLVYDLRGNGKSKVHIARYDFDALYEVYYPNPWKDNTLVEGLESELDRVPVH